MKFTFSILISLVLMASADAILLPILGGIFQQIRRQPEPLPPLSFLLMQHYLSRNVTIERTFYLGREALKVACTDEYQRLIDQTGLMQSNAYVEVPLTTFYQGTIDVDIAAERNGKTKVSERSGSAGLAFRIQSNDRYELIALRTVNGRLNFPPPSAERLTRAVQYASPSEWTLDKIRNQFPGRYEAAAHIGERKWHHLRISIKNNALTVFIDGNSTPVVQANLLGTKAQGSFAYWVDSGTNAYFSNLKIVEV